MIQLLSVPFDHYGLFWAPSYVIGKILNRINAMVVSKMHFEAGKLVNNSTSKIWLLNAFPIMIKWFWLGKKKKGTKNVDIEH